MTSTALTRPNGHTAPAGVYDWSADDVALIRQQVADKATDAEFKQLLYMAHKYGLDPLVRQIYCVKYGSKPAQIFAGRDGFLAIAHRSGAFDGMQTVLRIEPVPFSVEYTYYDDNQRKKGVFKREWQYVATTIVWRKGAAHPFTVEVWEEEYTSGRDLWTTKPRTMIGKVGECQALRRAFDISGLYDQDEIVEGRAAQPVEVRDVPALKQLAPAADADTGEILPGVFTEETAPITVQEIVTAVATGAVRSAERQIAAARPTVKRVDPALGALFTRLGSARYALGMSSEEIADAVTARLQKDWGTATAAELEPVVEYYERQAADVQGAPA